MLEDIGSSVKELEELGVSSHPRSGAKIDLFYTITKNLDPVSQLEEKPDGSWEAKMMFDIFELNLADPNSLEKLKLFVNRARNKEMLPTNQMWEGTIVTWPPEEVEG